MTPQLSSFLLKLICLQLLLHDLDISAQYSPQVVGRRPDLLALYPPESSVGMATDWAFCQQKCQEDVICVMFGWSANRRSCFLYPPESTFSGSTAFANTNGNETTYSEGLHNVLGRIEKTTSTLMWLSLGRPVMPVSYKVDGIPMAQMCEWACAASDGLLPCCGYGWKSSQQCLLFAGSFDDASQLQIDSGYADVRHKVDKPEPTANGTLILSANLAPTPPEDYTSLPFIITDITAIPLGHVDKAGLPKLASIEDGSYGTKMQCADECHNNPACHSFLWDDYSRNCRLFDVAVKGTIVLGNSYYGIIDRTTASATIEYLTASDENLIPVVLASYEPVMTIEECAQKCYEFHQPIYCNSFQLVETASRCLLYSIEIDKWDPGSVSVPFQSDCKLGVILGRQSYNQRYHAGDPSNQLIPIPPVIPPATNYHLEGAYCRVSNSPREEIQIKLKGNIDLDQLEVMCAHYCFIDRQWCQGYEVNTQTFFCRLFDIPISDPDSQLINDPNCIYANANGPEM